MNGGVFRQLCLLGGFLVLIRPLQCKDELGWLGASAGPCTSTPACKSPQFCRDAVKPKSGESSRFDWRGETVW